MHGEHVDDRTSRRSRSSSACVTCASPGTPTASARGPALCGRAHGVEEELAEGPGAGSAAAARRPTRTATRRFGRFTQFGIAAPQRSCPERPSGRDRSRSGHTPCGGGPPRGEALTRPSSLFRAARAPRRTPVHRAVASCHAEFMRPARWLRDGTCALLVSPRSITDVDILDVVRARARVDRSRVARSHDRPPPDLKVSPEWLGLEARRRAPFWSCA